MRIVLLLTLLLTIAGCSSTRFAYQQLDWAIVWWVEDYIPLTGAQEAALDRQVQAHLAWHCREELPRYDRWLASVDALVARPTMPAEQVAASQRELLTALDRLLTEITPTASALLASLDDRQVRDLAEAMAEHQQEDREAFLGDDPEDQRTGREERTRERAERWLGSLTPEQRDTIAAWNTARGNQTAIWLDGRARWQAALLDALRKRHADHFPERIRYLLLHSSEVRGPTYEAMLAQSREALTRLVTDLLNQATPEQRTHLRHKIGDLRADIQALTCTGERTSARADAPSANRPD